VGQGPKPCKESRAKKNNAISTGWGAAVNFPVEKKKGTHKKGEAGAKRPKNFLLTRHGPLTKRWGNLYLLLKKTKGEKSKRPTEEKKEEVCPDVGKEGLKH